ncbi:MAG: hypothetical protein A2351_00630 [Omnitrophica bacterium RIFOXYB12_FULL_50_7]|nr:MAG: hypothetical protein A2351_00630 [Omnitrophica bacterium RIFOXYB12_FULL_50_7]
MAIDTLIQQMKQGERRAVARLMTLVENDMVAAKEVSSKIFKDAGYAYVVGVTGAPGSGKSSLVNKIVKFLADKGARIGVIAVDPTSSFSGGALLGDRIRMRDNVTSEKVFIRSMATRGQQGGMARATKDMITILDVFGCEYIFIETVGVGQNEIDVHSTAHATLGVMVPGMGDEIQTLKAGILEICDIFVVNKTDHEGGDRLVSEIESMLSLSDKLSMDHDENDVISSTPVDKVSGWRPAIVKTNAVTGEGIPELWNAVEGHREFLVSSGLFDERLKKRFRKEVMDILHEHFRVRVEDVLDAGKNEIINDLLAKILRHQRSPYEISDIISKHITTRE